MPKKIKNWNVYQSYPHKSPPWVKLYRSLLDDLTYYTLPSFAAKCLPLIWLIASETDDGSIPEVGDLAFRLRIDEEECQQVLDDLSCYLVDIDAPPTPKPETKEERDKRLGLPKKSEIKPKPIKKVETQEAYPKPKEDILNPVEEYSEETLQLLRRILPLFPADKRPANKLIKIEWVKALSEIMSLGDAPTMIVSVVKYAVNNLNIESLPDIETDSWSTYKDQMVKSKAGGKASIYSGGMINVDYDGITQKWNEFAPTVGLAKIRLLSDTYKDKLRLRIKEGFNLDELIPVIEEQPFLYGENKKGWKIDFRWLIENQDNYLKVLEKKYVGKPNGATYRETQKKNPWE